MARRKFQTRLADDTAEQVDEYIGELGISQAEGVRRLIQAGLEAEADDDDEDDTDDDTERAAQRGTIYFLIIIGLLTLNLAATYGVI